MAAISSRQLQLCWRADRELGLAIGTPVEIAVE
jgi:hypothetical protein